MSGVILLADISQEEIHRAIRRIKRQLDSGMPGLRPYLMEELKTLQACAEEVVADWLLWVDKIQDVVEAYADTSADLANPPHFNQSQPDELALEKELPVSGHASGENDLPNDALAAAVFDWADETMAQFRKGMAFFDLLMWERAEQTLKAVLKATDEPLVRLYLAAVLTARGAREEAHSLVAGVLRTSTEADLQAAALEIQAQLAFESKDFALAKRALQKVCELCPDSLDAKFNLSICYLQTNEIQQGIRCLLEICATDGEDAETMLLLTQAYRKLGSTEDAYACCMKGLALSPTHPLLRLEKSRVLYEDGQVAQARAVALDLFQRDPTHEAVSAWTLWLLIHLGDFDRAVCFLKARLAISRDDPTSLLHLGVVCLLQDEPDAALRVLNRAWKTGEDKPLVALAIGVAEHRLNHHGKALEWMTLACSDERKPVRRLALYQVARLLQATGQHTEADGYLKSAHHLGAPNAAILAALAESARVQGKWEEASRRLEEVSLLIHPK